MIYPQKFKNFYQTPEEIYAATNLWAKQLASFDDKIIEQAMDSCPDRYTWMPEIAEFKALCMSFRTSERLPWAKDVIENINKKSNYVSRKPESINTQIDIGSDIIRRFIKIYPNKNRSEFPNMLTEMKKNGRILFDQLNEIQMLNELLKFSDEDFIGIFGKP